MNRSIWALVVVLGLISLSCKRDSITTPAPQPSVAEIWPTLIPADSPLVFISLQPMPNTFIDWLARSLGPVSDMLEARITEALEETEDENERAVLGELQNKMSRAGLESIGISLESRSAIYAVGASLVMRLELADGAAFAGFIERVETAAGEPIPKGQIGDISYRTITEDEITIAVAVSGDELIVALMHPNASEQILPVVFGQTPPERSLAQLGVLPSLSADYQLMGVAMGYLDVKTLVQTLTGRGSAFTQSTLNASGADIPELSPVCHQEMDALAAAFPRIVFGYRDMTELGFTSVAAIEMRSDLAQDLAAVVTPAPELGDLQQTKPIFATSLGIDLAKFMEFIKRKADEVAQSPYQCDQLAELNKSMSDMSRDLGSGLPPFLAGFQGLAMVVEELQVGGMMPTGSGYAMMNVGDPMSLINMATLVVPQLRQTNIQPDGTPVAVSIPAPGIDTVFLAAKGPWMGVSVGPGMDSRLQTIIESASAGSGGFALFAYNYQRLTGIMQEAQGATTDPDEAMIMQALGSLFGFSWVEMSVDARGLMMTQTVQSQ